MPVMPGCFAKVVGKLSLPFVGWAYLGNPPGTSKGLQGAMIMIEKMGSVTTVTMVNPKNPDTSFGKMCVPAFCPFCPCPDSGSVVWVVSPPDQWCRAGECGCVTTSAGGPGHTIRISLCILLFEIEGFQI